MNKTNYFGNEWIGLFAKTNNKYTIAPIDSPKKFVDELEECLKTTCILTTIGDTNLAGGYLCMNSNGIVLPNIASEKEKKYLEKETGLSVYISKTNYNAHANNIVVNDRCGLINPHVEENEKEKIEDALQIKLQYCKIADYSTIGSNILMNNRGFVANFRASEKELAEIEKRVGIKGARGTINTGVGFISLGAIANDNGYVVGNATTSYEMGRIEEVLEFIR
ncbi:MAG: translation initiation factor IF-6 [Candidatus Micrarchaeia archaeon]|jgi:translation initiation factor 6